MSKEKIILIGGGGHCKSVIDVIEAENKFVISGIIDVKEKLGQSILGYKIIGDDSDLKDLAKHYENFHISLGFIKSNTLRTKIYNELKTLKVNLPVIVSPNAVVSKYSAVGEGTIIMHNVVINAGATIGVNCIINTAAVIEHDTSIANNCHISTASIVNADCKIGENCFISSKVCVNRGLEIGNNVIVGSGSVVTKNIESNSFVYGVPAVQRK